MNFYTEGGLPHFTKWPRIPRLRRDIIITEKIDGTNAAVGFIPTDFVWADKDSPEAVIDGVQHVVYAQSRTRIITPEDDNYGFAKWAYDNAQALAAELGPGLHFGEWWGQGIQRGYGLNEKRFSLFNTKRWSGTEFTTPGLGMVPVLYQGWFGPMTVSNMLVDLEFGGSWAAPGFMRPEGVCVYHTAANMSFKVTLENDEIPKGKQ